MFLDIVEYDKVIEEIKAFELTESQTDLFLTIICENLALSTIELIEIAKKISKNEVVLMDYGSYSLNPMLNESSKTYNLLEFIIPSLLSNIPREIIGYLTETHVGVIVEKIFDLEFDETTTPAQLQKRIDEMFSSGDISIPVQGLRQQKISPDIILNGMIAQRLHKGIQFGKKFHNKPSNSLQKNKNTLRNALKDFNMVTMDDETPLSKILPKFIVVLKKLGSKK